MFRYVREISDPQPHLFWHSDSLDFTESARQEVYDWCTETFGPASSGYTGRWSVTEPMTRYYLRDETDAIHFRLRWCGASV